MKKYLLIGLFALLTLSVYSQNKESVKTSTSSGRYEIIQSGLARRCTFKLDKYTGKTWQLVSKSESGQVKWQAVDWLGSLSENNSNNHTIKYQIFMSGMVLADCFLINIQTGRTWLLYENEETLDNFWAPLDEDGMDL